jgi:TfoX/Sxy family transcriptional regulator of competence genes
MATDKRFVDYVLEQADLGEMLTYKRMFGEYALYHAGKVTAFACDNRLFIKPTPASRALAPGLPQGQPYPGSKMYPIADELLDDPEALRELLVATSAALPLPKPKKKRGKRSE